MPELVLTIPALPDLDLSANRRRSRHFMIQAKDTEAERLRAGLLLRAAAQESQVADIPAFNEYGMRIWPPAPPVALHWTLYWPKGTRARDADSCASLLAPWQNALVDLGWLKNDSPRYVSSVTYTSIPGSKQGPSMTLRIESLKEETAPHA